MAALEIITGEGKLILRDCENIIVCLFVTPSWSGTNALKFFIDNKYIIYKTNHSKI